MSYTTEVKSRSIISAFLAKLGNIYKTYSIIIGVIFQINEHCYFCEHSLSKPTRGSVIPIQQFTSLEGEGNWAEITFAKTPGIVFRDRGKNLDIS